MTKELGQVISTERLDMVPLSPEHAELLFESLQSEELYRFIPGDAPKTIQDLKSKYEYWSVGHSEDMNEIWLNFALFDPRIKKYVGTVQSTVNLTGNTYIAYEIFPPYLRQGFAREAVSSLIKHLFNNYGNNTITAHTDTRNTASIKLLESLGFMLSEMLPNADHFKGQSSDEYIYKLTKS